MKVLSTINSKHIGLDAKDKKLLYLLSINSRFPLSRIAKEVGLTRDAVKYRLDKLEKNEVITGYRTVFNIGKLGYSSYHIFLCMFNAKKELEKSILNFFNNHNNVNTIIKYSGFWDYELAIMVKNLSKLDEILNEIITKCKKDLQNQEVLILLKNYKSSSFPFGSIDNYKFIFKGKNDSSFYKDFLAKKEEVKLDDKDYKIMALLAKNARMQIRQISKRVGLSEDTVVYRIRKLIKGGVIVEFRPVINYSNLGYHVHALLFKLHNIDEEFDKNLRIYMETNPNVLWAVKTISKWNLLTYVIARDQGELNEIILKMRSQFGDHLRAYENLLAYEEVKYNFLPDEILDLA
jgi:DNA-binding Lrp family transcriptional regulator